MLNLIFYLNLIVKYKDHHCPWISNCVGRRNRKFFIIFLIFTTLLCSEILTLSILKGKKEYNNEKNGNRNIKRLIFLGIYTFISFIIGIYVTFMLILQVFLVFAGLTTNEYLRGTYIKQKNPFNEGCCRNFINFIKNDSHSKSINQEYLLYKLNFLTNQSEISIRISETCSNTAMEKKISLQEISVSNTPISDNLEIIKI